MKNYFVILFKIFLNLIMRRRENFGKKELISKILYHTLVKGLLVGFLAGSAHLIVLNIWKRKQTN